jgi:glutamyl-tRNA synthetase/glutamyl-Q tRNA(Asp) synthetase
LHLGHVVNAIYVWGVARARGGPAFTRGRGEAARVLLRIEDHDRIRSRPQFEAAILDDLDWLGFTPDEGRHPILRQSDSPAAYEAALRRLQRTHHVYACDCSRKEIGGERYDGRCRDRTAADDVLTSAACGIRVQIDDEPEHFDDLLLGPTRQVPAAQCGDILLRDRDGHWTYQFAATVDDMNQGIDLVIRGADLLSSTGRQIKLARMLGRETPPHFLHHPLIVKPGGEKLSKASGDTGVRELRRAGASAAEVIGRAAAAVGLIEAPRPLAAIDVATLF